ncbi:MAG: hypothetical protein JW741_19210, partial [Sedimentisphaerales bacterium]|nr:hypothetical protein [Sedimentisphaerales bacterium]
MNHRRRMLEVLQGHTPQGLLFVPRLDIWCNRNKARGTLPAGCEHLTLPEIAAKLGVGFHSVVPDFLRTAPPEDLYHRALGFYNNPEFPYRVDFSRVDFDVDTTDTHLQVAYRTRAGCITTRCAWGQSLLDSGVSIPDILEHAVKTPDDYLALADILSNVFIHPTPAAYEHYHARIGDTGLAVAFLSLACSPMQHILRDLRKFEAFCLDLYDCPAQMTPLCD